MLRMSLGLPCLIAVRAIVSMAVKLKDACMKACDNPLTLKWSSSSHSLALPNTLSMLTRLLNIHQPFNPVNRKVASNLQSLANSGVSPVGYDRFSIVLFHRLPNLC